LVYTPCVSNPRHFGCTHQCGRPPSITTRTATTYFFCVVPRPLGECLNFASDLRAPPGCPQSVASQEKHCLAPFLGANMRREIQPLSQLTTGLAASLEYPGWESAVRLNLPSQVRAERVERNDAFPVRDRPRAPRRGACTRRHVQAHRRRLRRQTIV